MKTKIIVTLALAISIASTILSGQAESATESLENKVKKIVMMMNIVNKEYALGIQAGKVINRGEYEESQMFIDQAFERYKKLPSILGSEDTLRNIAQQFSELTQDMKDKADPAVTSAAVNSINSSLMKVKK